MLGKSTEWQALKGWFTKHIQINKQKPNKYIKYNSNTTKT
jgi:hypothetical protein